MQSRGWQITLSFASITGLLFAFIAVCACSGKPSAEGCQGAVLRYWASLDIEPYFSAVSLSDAVEHCREKARASVVRCIETTPIERLDTCPQASELLIDTGWQGGITCYQAEDGGRSRCERSNRECEYYRRVAKRAGRKVSRCQLATAAWALRVGEDHVNPAPSMEACEQIRADLIARGAIDTRAVCEEVDYAKLRAGRRKFIASPSVD